MKPEFPRLLCVYRNGQGEQKYTERDFVEHVQIPFRFESMSIDSQRHTGVLEGKPSGEATLLNAHEKEDAARGMSDAMFF
jgi:hypothetical protein